MAAKKKPADPTKRKRILRRAADNPEEIRQQDEAEVAAMPVKHPRAAGIDIGDKSRWACVGLDAPDLVREFPAHTEGLHRSKGALGAFLRRMKGKLGKASAVAATAHKSARIVYLTLKHGKEYVRKSEAECMAEQEAKRRRWLERKAREMGYELVKAEPEAGKAEG